MKINWIGYRYIREDGYGRYNIAMIRALARAGVEVLPMVSHLLFDAPPDVLKLTGFDPSLRSIFCQPPMTITFKPPAHSWILTMHEDSKLPKGWSTTINQFERCIVPCEQNREAFEASGVTIPIHVIPGGTAPDEFPVEIRPLVGHPYTFVTLGDRHIRKGWETVWGAWYKAFPESLDDVRLIVKFRPEMVPHWFEVDRIPDKRITFCVDNLPDMREVFRQADCVVYPSKGDGWGMWWREAVAMGKPAIVTNWSGNAVGVNDCAIPLNDYKLVESHLNTGGKWALPSEDEVAEKMKWCYEHRIGAQLIGLRGSYWIRQHQTWDHSAQALIALLEQYT